MGREKKNIVEYFPMPVNDGAKMYVMEQQYGDKGYCCYYKLLQLIGRTHDHVLDFSDAKSLLFFSSIIRATPEATLDMINTLSELEAIDPFLWKNGRKIWCQVFVDHVSIVYKNRRRNAPQKPILPTGNNGISTGNNGISTVEKIPTVEKTPKITTENIPITTVATVDMGVSTENNGISTEKSTQRRGEEKKENIYKNFANPEDFEELKKADIWRANCCASLKISETVFFQLLETWWLETKAKETEPKNQKEAKQYFFSWAKYQIPKLGTEKPKSVRSTYEPIECPPNWPRDEFSWFQLNNSDMHKFVKNNPITKKQE